MGYTEIVGSVMARLAGVAPCARGLSAVDEGQTTSAPRFVFVWRGVSAAPAGVVARSALGRDSTEQTTLSVNNPRPLQVDRHELDVHIWAQDSAGVERMRAALIQAVRVQLGGRRYQELGAKPGDESVTATEGMKMIVSMALFIELPGVQLPPVVTPAAPGDNPTTSTVPASLPTVTVTAIDNDPSGQTPGDGILDSGEP